jgi:hypothetical protein
LNKSRMIGAIGTLTLATFGALAGVMPAQASAPKPEHKTVVTTVTDRADGGNHGVWATDTITRTVEVTGGPVYVVPAPQALKADGTQQELCDSVAALGLRWNYTAKVTDKGAFVTVDGKSPNAGKGLKAGTKGTVEGSFTATFTAPAHWCSFDAKTLQGKTVKGDNAPKTSEWVKSLFTAEFDGNSINDDWTWTYTTCTEKWWDASDAKSNDGETDAAGDITGKACEAPKPERPGGNGTGSGGGASSGSDGGLPVTGVPAGAIAGGALALLFVGAFLVGVVRRRRLRFTA